MDEGVSGVTKAAERPWLQGRCSGYVREGDTLAVYAVDRLGRDALSTYRPMSAPLLDGGVMVDVHGLGVMGAAPDADHISAEPLSRSNP